MGVRSGVYVSLNSSSNEIGALSDGAQEASAL